MSAIPGAPGYATLWDLIEVWPTASFDASIMPIMSEAALMDAFQRGQVILIDDEIALHAVVMGPA